MEQFIMKDKPSSTYLDENYQKQFMIVVKLLWRNGNFNIIELAKQRQSYSKILTREDFNRLMMQILNNTQN